MPIKARLEIVVADWVNGRCVFRFPIVRRSCLCW